jgi:hypothetical protein
MVDAKKHLTENQEIVVRDRRQFTVVLRTRCGEMRVSAAGAEWKETLGRG